MSKKHKKSKAKKRHEHRYGGWTSVASPIGPSARLRCADCGEEYMPRSAFMVRPIGAPEPTDCPHPTYGETRFGRDPFVRRCLVCGRQERFMGVRCVGGPMDGEIDKVPFSSLAKDDGWSIRTLSTTRGQEPDEHGSTTMFSYRLRWDDNGIPWWDGIREHTPERTQP